MFILISLRKKEKKHKKKAKKRDSNKTKERAKEVDDSNTFGPSLADLAQPTSTAGSQCWLEYFIDTLCFVYLYAVHLRMNKTKGYCRAVQSICRVYLNCSRWPMDILSLGLALACCRSCLAFMTSV